MADDLLDYTLDTDILGKSVGADLKEGKVTLPVIYSLKKASSRDRDVMAEIIKDPNFSLSDFKKLIELLNRYHGLTHTRDLAKHYVNKAKDALTVFKSSETKDILLMLADYAVARNT